MQPGNEQRLPCAMAASVVLLLCVIQIWSNCMENVLLLIALGGR